MPPDRRSGQPPVISASEVGRFVYCQRAWWLERVVGQEPANSEALERGRRSHHDHGRLVARASRYASLAGWLVVLALAIALVLARALVGR